jgi:hypothetical protein
VPATEVELGHGYESLYGVVDLGDGQHGLRMCHEAAYSVSALIIERQPVRTHFVMRSNIDRGSRIKVGSVTRLRSAPGRSWEMIWESTE